MSIPFPFFLPAKNENHKSLGDQNCSCSPVLQSWRDASRGSHMVLRLFRQPIITQDGGVDASISGVYVTACVRALKEKWLGLATPNLVHWDTLWHFLGFTDPGVKRSKVKVAWLWATGVGMHDAFDISVPNFQILRSLSTTVVYKPTEVTVETTTRTLIPTQK